MKKFIAVLLFATSFYESDAQVKYKNLAKFGAFLGSFNVTYERVLDKRSAVALAPAYGGFSSMGIKYRIAGVGGEYRYYLPLMKKQAPNGFYLSPGIGFYGGKASYKFSNGLINKTNISGTAIKSTAGFQHVFKNKFVLDVNAGTQYIVLKFKGGFFAQTEAFRGFQPYVGVGLGYAF